MRTEYVVKVDGVPPCYKPRHFPRRFRYKKEAIAAAKEAVAAGAAMARVECPNGGELDFRPDKKQQ